ncbi:MAG: radical SAM family heme chaperone HemW [Porphyromonadaceae bacterium]|nr:radical SAM family heme chaperone HemW [Porphyromonadaceae bacterium]
MNIYIHVPFCAQRCSYCDFYTQTQMSLRVAYLRGLLRELEMRRSELPQGSTIEHIYLGGGTPSLLSIDELTLIFEQIYRLYPVSSGGEITLEANPDDINLEYASGLRQLPINRISMGVQSFQEADLKFLNRRHSRAQVYSAVETLRSVGLEEISLDLIYGLPGQTETTWGDNIRQILSLDVPHISAYHLIYEEGTPLMRMLEHGKVTEVSEEASLMFFKMLIERLGEAGYDHYEISNFAKPNHHARLNTGYWLGNHYLGFGPAAHSYDGVSRSYNVASIDQYARALECGGRSYTTEELTEEHHLHEYIMTRLRTMWGINLEDMTARFGSEVTSTLLSRAEPHLSSGKLIQMDSVLCLTPSGVFISDGILVDLFD